MVGEKEAVRGVWKRRFERLMSENVRGEAVGHDWR